MKHIHLFVFGRVQGVFFRLCTKQQADKLDISGWVRNRKDGSVEIFASGKEDNLRSLIKWCHLGSPYSEVQCVEKEWQESKERFVGFIVYPTL